MENGLLGLLHSARDAGTNSRLSGASEALDEGVSSRDLVGAFVASTLSEA